MSKLVILNTPLGLKTPLRPELAAYKNPLAFLRPRPGARFDAANYNAAGGPYAMSFRDAQAYDAPYESDPAASAAVAATMESLDYAALLRRVDEGWVLGRGGGCRVLHERCEPPAFPPSTTPPPYTQRCRRPPS